MLSWHHDVIQETLQWTPSFLPCQPCWLWAACLGLCTCLWASSVLLSDIPSLLVPPNQRCISTNDGKGRQLNQVFLGYDWNLLAPVRYSASFHAIWLLHDIPDVINILSVSALSLSGLSSPYSLMSNLAASGLNPSGKYISWSTRQNFQAIVPNVPPWCSLWLCSSLSSGAMFNIKVAPFLHILHQSFPLLHWLLWCQGLTPLVCCLCPDHSLLWPCPIRHLSVPSAEGQ